VGQLVAEPCGLPISSASLSHAVRFATLFQSLPKVRATQE
jgi:hypothetical protein